MNADIKAALVTLLKLLVQPEPTPVPVIPGKKPRHKRVVVLNHATLVLPETAVQPETKGKAWTAEIKGGLIIVVYRDKQAYIDSPVTPKDVFGYSGKAKEWRASEKWVRLNKPEVLKTLGLK